MKLYFYWTVMLWSFSKAICRGLFSSLGDIWECLDILGCDNWGWQANGISWVENRDSLNIPQHTGWTAATGNNPGPDINRTKVGCLGLGQGFFEGKSSGSGTPEELAWQRQALITLSTSFLLTLAAGVTDPTSPQEEINFNKGKLPRTTRPESGRVERWNQPPLAAKAGPHMLHHTRLCIAPCWSCYAHSHLNLRPNIPVTQTQAVIIYISHYYHQGRGINRNTIWEGQPAPRKKKKYKTSQVPHLSKKLGNGWE